MVVNATEHGIQADVIFVIEGTAANGAYFNDLKTNYLIPTLEYFNQGNIEDREYVTENSTTRYGIVIYHAADCLPRPCTDTFGPYSNPHKLLQRLDNLEMVGGRGESHANIAEGLATALVGFENLQLEREPSTASQKHCILVCNSPPYQISVQETAKFLGCTIESLPPLFQKRNINLSLVSPRKIPEFFKLLELAMGDPQSSQIKNYAKDPRNLVLLHNLNLKERAENPTNVTPVHTAAANTVQIPSSPVPVHDSPNTNQPNANIPQHPAPQNPAFRNATPINLGFNHGATVQSNSQGAALIAQLAQPPTALTSINVPFNQRMEANGMQPSAPAPQAPQQNQQAQLTPQQQQQIRSMYLQQQQQQQLQQQTMQIAPIAAVSSTGTSGPTSVQQKVTQTTAAAPQHQPVAAGAGQVTTRERPPIWQGVLEWPEMAKNPTDAQKQTRQVLCRVTANPKDSEPELKADSWPGKLTMHLMPKQLFGSIGGGYLKNSKSVLFHPTPCEALESLTKIMSLGFAGCVYITSASALPACEFKVLILLYYAEKRTYRGFIPNDQAAFVDRIRKAIQHQKSSPAASRGQILPPSAGGPSGSSTATSVPPQTTAAAPQHQPVTAGAGQVTTRDRPPIWQGELEWHEKAKNPTDTQKQTRQVLCRVTANPKDSEPELKADSWPRKLTMHLMHKQLINSIGGDYFKNSRKVVFHPTPCEALESLTEIMSAGFAGCVHFTSAAASSVCEIIVLILIYYAEKRAYIGLIPNDQAAFADRIRKVIQQKSSQAASRGQIFPPTAGGPSGPSTATSIPPQMPPAGGIVSQGGIMMSQTNTMTMGGGQITQVPTQQQGLANQQPNQGQMNLQGAMAQQGVENSGAGMISGHQQQQRQMYENNSKAARQQNLMKIHQLKQTLEAAQQQEAQYKSQYGVNIQQNLEVAQQPEMQFEQQIEAQQQAQRGLNPNAGMAGQQPNAQRMMRPAITSNLQLRHLLQQQHNPQQVLGMQQQMVGPRGQINVRPINNNNQPNQQFDDVSNYDFNR